MLSAFINAALKKAKYETLEDGKVYAEVSELQGIWAEGKTVEECRNELVEVIEDGYSSNSKMVTIYRFWKV